MQCRVPRIQQSVELTTLPPDLEIEASSECRDHPDDDFHIQLADVPTLQPRGGRTRNAGFSGQIRLTPRLLDPGRATSRSESQRIHSKDYGDRALSRSYLWTDNSSTGRTYQRSRWIISFTGLRRTG